MLIPQSALTAGKHALLIAIQDYSNPDFNLTGPDNDVELTEAMLRKRFGFQDDDFIIIKDAQATHTGIENAFKALIERVQPDDFVYIFYSGHGSQTADLNGDEPSGSDQTWVSYGARASDDKNNIDNYDVLDDEINVWLSALCAKTDQVIFVSDSCHSGSVSRDEVVVRTVIKDKRPHLLGERPYKQLKTRRGIRVGAARDDEAAINKPGKDYGLFTWYWIHNLQQAQAGDTWDKVFRWTYAQVTAERYGLQHPRIEGELSQQALGGDFTPLPKIIPIKIISEEWVKILAGSFANVTEGSVYRLYKPQDPNQQDLPRLTIIKVRAFDSFGEPESEGRFQDGDFVVEESHAYPLPSIKVYLEAEFPERDKFLLEKIRAAFQPDLFGRHPLRAYILTDDPKSADLRLYLSHDVPELRVLSPELRLLYGLKIPFDAPKKGVKLLQDNLEKFAQIRRLKKLKNPDGDALPVTVQVSILSPVDACPTGADCVELPDNRGLHRRAGPYRLQELDRHTPSKGDILDFIWHNESEEDYYCYLVTITPNGAIYAIFPEPYVFDSEAALIKAGEKRRLTDEVVLPMNEFGENTLKVIISTKSIDVSLFEQPNLRRHNYLNPLELLLVNALDGKRGSVSVDNDEWATAQVIFEVDA
jgi:hypothetical protein